MDRRFSLVSIQSPVVLHAYLKYHYAFLFHMHMRWSIRIPCTSHISAGMLKSLNLYRPSESGKGNASACDEAYDEQNSTVRYCPSKMGFIWICSVINS